MPYDSFLVHRNERALKLCKLFLIHTYWTVVNNNRNKLAAYINFNDMLLSGTTLLRVFGCSLKEGNLMY